MKERCGLSAPLRAMARDRGQGLGSRRSPRTIRRGLDTNPGNAQFTACQERRRLRWPACSTRGLGMGFGYWYGESLGGHR